MSKIGFQLWLELPRRSTDPTETIWQASGLMTLLINFCGAAGTLLKVLVAGENNTTHHPSHGRQLREGFASAPLMHARRLFGKSWTDRVNLLARISWAQYLQAYFGFEAALPLS
jgi:hypothetical protein